MKSTSKCWPSNISSLQEESNQPPNMLIYFLSVLVGGRKPDLTCHQEQVTASIAQYICFITTKRKWKTSKHVSLSLTLHHLTRGSKIITLLNRYGHCCSYSFVLEAETAICASVLKNPDALPKGILAEEAVTTMFVWNNWDVLGR